MSSSGIHVTANGHTHVHAPVSLSCTRFHTQVLREYYFRYIGLSQNITELSFNNANVAT